RAGHRAEHRLRRGGQPARAPGPRHAGLDRAGLWPRARPGLRQRPARDGPAAARARLVALLVQPRRGGRPARRGRGRGVGARDAEGAQRAGRTPPGGGGIDRRGRGRLGLVRSTAAVLLARRQAPRAKEAWMSRRIVLGTLIAAGAFSLAVSAYQAPPAAAPAPSPKVVEVEKVKDNLYVLKGGGGNTAVFVG